MSPSPRPLRAWAAVQAAAVWNRTERDLRQAWYTGLKGASLALLDDADLYPWLWGRSWSWIWLLVPLAVSILTLLAVAALWSHQLQAGLPAAGPWFHLPILLVLVGTGLGVAASLGHPPRMPQNQPWPIRRGQMRALALLGPFLHPTCGLAILLGLASGLPWLAARPLLGLGWILLPLGVFRLSLEGRRLNPRLKRRPGTEIRVPQDPEQALRTLIRRLLGRGLPWIAGGLAARLIWSGALVAALGVLAFAWALAQADILRIERRAASLVALWPLEPERKLEARLAAVRRWAAPSGVMALASILLTYGPVAALPGVLALLEVHWTGAALGLSASAAAPLEVWSLFSLQSLGSSVAVGGLLSGWLMGGALASPLYLGVQLVAVAGAWMLLQRTKRRVCGNWRAIQEGLIGG